MTLHTIKSVRRFTLVEMLITIGIILILAAMLLPVAAKSRQRARTTTCQAQIQQIGRAFIAYAA
jgi:prepilin-type N-terminal cleavage/methylation domain-containing protein